MRHSLVFVLPRAAFSRKLEVFEVNHYVTRDIAVGRPRREAKSRRVAPVSLGRGDARLSPSPQSMGVSLKHGAGVTRGLCPRSNESVHA